MAQPSFLIPFPMTPVTARTTQEPKSASDTPAGPGTTVGPTAPGTGTQAPGGPTPGQPMSPCGLDNNMLLFMGLGLFAMWFLVMRPENKRRKQQQEMLAAIKAGDHVVTLGGMHGTVASLTDKTVTLRIDTQKVVFDRAAIARVERDEVPVEARKS